MLDPEKSGMIPRAVLQIFDELSKNTEMETHDEDAHDELDAIDSGDNSCDESDSETVISEVLEVTQVFVSIYQIYNENVNDLLQTTDAKVNANLRIR